MSAKTISTISLICIAGLAASTAWGITQHVQAGTASLADVTSALLIVIIGFQAMTIRTLLEPR